MTKIIVFAVSDDYDKVRSIEKDLWENKQNAPFEESSIKIAPDPRPGYKPFFYLNIFYPSDKIIKDIKPSIVSPGKYPQFEKFTDEDMKELIKTMLYIQKKDPRDIAKDLGVTVADVMVWRYYSLQ